jgi:hypothetical protein
MVVAATGEALMTSKCGGITYGPGRLREHRGEYPYIKNNRT